MSKTEFLTNYWKTVERKDKTAFLDYFHDDAVIYLHDSNERLTPEYYISDEHGNDDWQMTIDRMDELGDDQIVTITFHRSSDWVGFITSFFTFEDDKIIELNEYFSPCDDNVVPQWRDDLAEVERIK